MHSNAFRARAAFAGVTAAIALFAAIVPATLAAASGTWSAPGGISLEGRPNFHAGDGPATYIWHDNNGWHLRTSAPAGKGRKFGGSVTVVGHINPHFVVTAQFKADGDDTITMTANNVIQYQFGTFPPQMLDGFDFRVTGKTVVIRAKVNGSTAPTSQVVLGGAGANPLTNPFTATFS
jgi:hypothetical protein